MIMGAIADSMQVQFHGVWFLLNHRRDTNTGEVTVLVSVQRYAPFPEGECGPADLIKSLGNLPGARRELVDIERVGREGAFAYAREHGIGQPRPDATVDMGGMTERRQMEQIGSCLAGKPGVSIVECPPRAEPGHKHDWLRSTDIEDRYAKRERRQCRDCGIEQTAYLDDLHDGVADELCWKDVAHLSKYKPVEYRGFVCAGGQYFNAVFTEPREDIHVGPEDSPFPDECLGISELTGRMVEPLPLSLFGQEMVDAELHATSGPRPRFKVRVIDCYTVKSNGPYTLPR